MKVISFATFWNSRDNYRLIDVREEHEYQKGRVVGAEHHALSRIQEGDYPELDVDERPIALICQMGGRSGMACQLLEQAGLGEFTNVNGGTTAAMVQGTECIDCD